MEISAIEIEKFFRKIRFYISHLVLSLLISTAAWSGHEEVQCVLCHNPFMDQPISYSYDDQSLSKSLICLSCHDASRDVSGLNPPPVFNGRLDLAGGSFTSTLISDKVGHNIQSIDTILALTPPGGFPLSEFGCLSCHDPHQNGNFRNLKKEINGKPTPVQALGDPDYQKNVYISGMNNFCGACHEKLYGNGNARGIKGWVRHPVGITISEAEHADYERWFRLDDRITQAENPSGNPDDLYGARVFCLSCHRAHASPFDNALRWDYRHSTQGCLECHTF